MPQPAFVAVDAARYRQFEAWERSQGQTQLLGAMQAMVLTSPSKAAANRRGLQAD